MTMLAQPSGHLDRSCKVFLMVNPIDKLAADDTIKEIGEVFDISGDPLDRLEWLRWMDAAVERLIDEAVYECRTNAVPTATGGYRAISWRRIGDALGISGQSAHERFKHLV